MAIYSYEEAFGAWDKTSRPMRSAIDKWIKMYYGDGSTGQDSCQRIAYTVVSKLVRTVFGEYQTSSDDPFCRQLLAQLKLCSRQALEMALVGGSCFIKPCLCRTGFSFTLIPRQNVLVFGYDSDGVVTDMGTVEKSVMGRYYYTLLERRSVDRNGYLTIRNTLYRSVNRENLGVRVSLQEHPDYSGLAELYCYPEPVHSVGLIQLKTPMLNCVDGSGDGVSVYAAAAELIACIDENEAQLRGEFQRGQSRIIVSRDLLKPDENGNPALQDHLFVGLDEDPEQLGITVFSPQLRQQSYLERKQEYLRNVESVIGLKRGMLSDANAQDRTATEISASAADYNLTVMDFQKMWEQAVGKTLALCAVLARLYRMERVPVEAQFSIDWGNGVLYDEDKTWQSYLDMVKTGLLKPEIALGWRFQMPSETPQQQAAIRSRLMPENV